MVIVFFLALAALRCGSCNKDHYDLNNVQGVDMEGEVLLPIASGRFTIMQMMERFGIDSVITFENNGEMMYHYTYEHKGAITGNELLHFRDEDVSESWPLPAIALQMLTAPIDTTVRYSQSVEMHSDHINVYSAKVKTGKIRCRVGFSSSAVQVRRFRIHCPEITAGQGNELLCEIPQGDDYVEIDMEGFSFQTDEANTFHFDFQLDARLYPSVGNVGSMDFMLRIDELTVSEMTGWIEPHNSYSRIETEFDLFPDNVMGTIDLEDVDLRLSMRNGFDLPARLVVDTAEVTGEGFAPIQLFESLPQVIELDNTPAYEVIFHRTMDGRIGSHGAIATATSNFILNPDGLTNRITVADTCSLAVKADVDIPLSFTVNEVHYFDTVIFNLSENLSGSLPMLESGDWIKKLTLDLDLTSNIPLDLEGRILMYNSENGEVMDILADNVVLVSASLDGQPVNHSVSIEVTNDRIERMMKSDRMILDFDVDTQAREIDLNANQFLHFFVKCKVGYDGIIDIKSTENE